MCESRSLPPGHGTQICPPWRWPASTRSNAPAGGRRSTPGKWQMQDPQVGVRVGELLRARLAQPARERVDARRAGPRLPRSSTVGRLVLEQRRRARGRRAASRPRTGRGCPRGRGCRAPRSSAEAAASSSRSSGSPLRPRDEVAADHGQVGLELRGPLDGLPHRDARRATGRRDGSPRGARSAGRRARAAARESARSSRGSFTQPASKCPQARPPAASAGQRSAALCACLCGGREDSGARAA